MNFIQTLITVFFIINLTPEIFAEESPMRPAVGFKARSSTGLMQEDTKGGFLGGRVSNDKALIYVSYQTGTLTVSQAAKNLALVDDTFNEGAISNGKAREVSLGADLKILASRFEDFALNSGINFQVGQNAMQYKIR